MSGLASSRIHHCLLLLLGLVAVNFVSIKATPCHPPTVYVRAELVRKIPKDMAQIHILNDPIRGRILAKDIVFETGPHFRVAAVYNASLEYEIKGIRLWALDRRVKDSRLIYCRILPDYIQTPLRQSDQRRNDKRAVPSLLNVRKGPCAQRRCPYRGKCVVEDGKAVCQCQSLCPARYRPVCGSDGRTYSNSCSLKRKACLDRRVIRVRHPGRCGFVKSCAKSNCPHPFHKCMLHGSKPICLCPNDCRNAKNNKKEPQAVCGSDGLTYSSTCHLQRRACRHRLHLTVLHKGGCSDAGAVCQRLGLNCSPTQICQASPTKNFECRCPACDGIDQSLLGSPVCGMDGLTRKTACHLLKENCESGQQLAVRHNGPCEICEKMKCQYYSICSVNQFGKPECICPNSCTKTTIPVCGSDGKTYDSTCDMKVHACSLKKNVTIMAYEPCRVCLNGCPMGTHCVHGECQCRPNCPGLKMSVCGSDGRMYRNECELKRQACISKTSVSIDFSGKACPRNDQPLVKEGRKKSIKLKDGKEFLNKTGPKVGVSMTRTSFAVLKPLQSFRRYNTLHLVIIPNSTNGTIVFLGRPNAKTNADSMSLELEDGHVIYRFNLGSGFLVLKSKKPVTIGKIHRVSISRKGRWGRLTVDGNSLTGRSLGRLRGLRFKPDHKFIFGRVAARQRDGFSGCIQTAVLVAHRSGKEFNLMDSLLKGENEDVESQNIKPGCGQHICSKNPCKNEGVCNTVDNIVVNCTCSKLWIGKRCEKKKPSSSFRVPAFNGQSFITIPPSVHKLKPRKFELEIWFLTNTFNGLLAQLAPIVKHYLRIELMNGRLQIQFRSGMGLIEMRSVDRVPLGEWIQLHVRKSRRFVFMTIDGQKETRMRIVPNYFRKLERSKKRKVTAFKAHKKPLYIGGYPKDEEEDSTTRTVWFQGAIQRVIVNRKIVDLYSKGVIRTDNLGLWRGLPCSKHQTSCGIGQECEPYLNRARCVCTSQPCAEAPQHDEPVLVREASPKISSEKAAAINFNGMTLLKYSSPPVRKSEGSELTTFGIKIKTISRQGMILFSTQSHGRSAAANFYLLALRQGFPELAFNVGGSNGLIRIRGRDRVNDNKWHTLQAVRSGILTTFLVDGEALTGKINSTEIYLKTDGNVFIGGVPTPIAGFPWVYNQGFMGCMQELRIDLEHVDLWRLGTAVRGEMQACSLPYEF